MAGFELAVLCLCAGVTGMHSHTLHMLLFSSKEEHGSSVCWKNGCNGDHRKGNKPDSERWLPHIFFLVDFFFQKHKTFCVYIEIDTCVQSA